MARSDKYSRKLHPWLRVVQNGTRDVNAVRADGSTRVACATPVGTDGLDTAPEVWEGLGQSAAYLPTIDVGYAAPPVFRAQPRPKMSTSNDAKDSYVNVLVALYPEHVAGGVDEVLKRLRDEVAGDLSTTQRLTGTSASQDTVARELIARRNLICATVPVTDSEKLMRDPAVTFIHPAVPSRCAGTALRGRASWSRRRCSSG